MDKKSYKEVIEEDIRLVEKYIPSENVMKKHIIGVLKQSIEFNYPEKYWDIKKPCKCCGQPMKPQNKVRYLCTNPYCDDYIRIQEPEE